MKLNLLIYCTLRVPWNCIKLYEVTFRCIIDGKWYFLNINFTIFMSLIVSRLNLNKGLLVNGYSSGNSPNLECRFDSLT